MNITLNHTSNIHIFKYFNLYTLMMLINNGVVISVRVAECCLLSEIDG